MTDRIVIFYGSKKDFEELVATETSKEQVTIHLWNLFSTIMRDCVQMNLA